MKKLDRRIERKLPPAELYIEDIEQIVGALKQIDPKVSVKHADYKLDDPSELETLAGVVGARRVSNVDVRAGEFSFDAVHIDPFSARLELSKDDALHRGVADQVAEVFGKRKKLLSPSRLYFALFVLSVLGWATAEGWQHLFSAMLFALAWVVLWRDIPAYAVVNLTRRSGRPSIMERYGDQLVIALVAAVAGSVATFLLGKL